MPYAAIVKHRQNINMSADASLERLLEYLKKEGLTFYELSGPFIVEKSEGSNRYIHVTISIKLA